MELGAETSEQVAFVERNKQSLLGGLILGIVRGSARLAQQILIWQSFWYGRPSENPRGVAPDWTTVAPVHGCLRSLDRGRAVRESFGCEIVALCKGCFERFRFRVPNGSIVV